MPTPPLPTSTHTLRNVIIGGAAALLLAWLFGQLAPMLAPFIVAAILAYILNPVVLKLTGASHAQKRSKPRYTLPRSAASALVMALLMVLCVALALLVVPVLRTEAALLQTRLPALLEQANTVWLPWLKLHFGITLTLDIASLKAWLSGLSTGDDVVSHALTAVKTGGAAVLGFVGNAVLALILAFYLLMDWPDIVARVRALVPKRWAGVLGKLTQDCDAVLGQYLRGQLAVMLALCVYYCAALWLAGFDVALPVGVITGLLIVVPYLGFAFGLLLALAAAVLQFQGSSGVVWVAVIYGFGQVLEGFFLTPRWVGASLGLHPAAVIFALLAFGQLLGFAGVLLALPLAAVVVVVGQWGLGHYQASAWYHQR